DLSGSLELPSRRSRFENLPPGMALPESRAVVDIVARAEFIEEAIVMPLEEAGHRLNSRSQVRNSFTARVAGRDSRDCPAPEVCLVQYRSTRRPSSRTSGRFVLSALSYSCLQVSIHPNRRRAST